MRTGLSRIVAVALVSLGVVGCSGGTSSPTSPGGAPAPSASIPQTSAAPSQAAATPTPKQSITPGPGDVVYSGRIDVGGGRKLEVRCAGVGSPTILLEGGGITPSMDEYPSAFVFDLSKTTTTCQYSRAGGGTSTAPAGTRTMAGLVDDVYAMLAALDQTAGVKGPYLFAGWSYGGTVALANALADPDRTAGLVILDTGFPIDFLKLCAAAGRAKADCRAEYDGDIEAKAMEAELTPQIHPLPDIPLRIVTAMRLPECDPAKPETLRTDIDGKIVTAKDCLALATLFASSQKRDWSTVNPKLQQTLVDADHNGLIDQAGNQIKGLILDLVRTARANP